MPIIAALLLVTAVLLFAAAPSPILAGLRELIALWNLVLLATVVGTLLWFLYSFFLRRIIRARRIASARMRRMMREAAERESGEGTP